MNKRLGVAGAASISLACALVCGCGSSDVPELKVSAASSLRVAFGQYAAQLRGVTVRYSFAGSDALAAQIEQGARPDVFASADTQLPAELFAKGLVETPVEFAANRLVLAVPASSEITSLADAMKPGVTIAIGTPTVPIGAYTATVLTRLPAGQRKLLEGNIRDKEPDVTGIVGKLTQGAIDAGFIYRTDVSATKGALRAIQLPESLQPQVAYAAAVVRGGSNPTQARAFIAGLLSGRGRTDLKTDGFLPSSR